MKRLIFIILLIVVATTVYWRLSAREEAPDPVPSPAMVAAAPSTKVPQAIPSEAPAPAFQAAPSPRTTDSPEKRGLVEFKVVNGLAIAYGDVLLGKPRQGDAPEGKGFYEIPQPQLWDRPEIPYVINPDLPNPKRVTDAIEYFNQATAVKFVPYDGQQRDALVFEQGDEHCYSYLGRIGGLQPVKLSEGCGRAEVIHEIMHSLGFIHEQSRTDRDQFIEINWDNIDSKYHNQFAIVPEGLMSAIGDSPFDFRSVMLYRPDTFALKAGTPAISSKPGKPAVDPVIGGLTDTDRARLNRMFGTH